MPTRWRRHRAAPLGLSLLLASCSGLAPSPKASPEEVAALERKLVEWQRRATVSEIEVTRLREEIAALERQLEEARREPPPATYREPVGAVVEDVETGPIGLVEDIEESELEEPPTEGTPPEPADRVPRENREADDGVRMAPEQAVALYDEGYTLFHQERYADAQARFERYLELYPATDLADNAQFWIGETHYARGDWASALRGFTATIEHYPDGNKVPDALLKAGKCLEALGRIDQARQTYHEVTDSFPDSTAAAAARDRLAALR